MSKKYFFAPSSAFQEWPDWRKALQAQAQVDEIFNQGLQKFIEREQRMSVKQRFAYKKADTTQAMTIRRIYEKLGTVAEELAAIIPAGKERLTMIELLEDAAMWGAKAVMFGVLVVPGERNETVLDQSDADPTRDVLNEVRQERIHQNRKWGGAEHDDQHAPQNWLTFIQSYLGAAAATIMGRDEEEMLEEPAVVEHYRLQLLKTAALCVAAIETLDRKRR